jgi:YD repeat-containing protein
MRPFKFYLNFRRQKHALVHRVFDVGNASPSIQRMFRNSDNFGMMVQRGYPMVWRPANSRFLEFAQDQRGPYQLVEITDSDGRIHTLRYDMIETPAGWRIRGVQVLPGMAFSS